MARGMHVVDHLNQDGVDGILTITGGKLTTCLMAERIVDIACQQMGEDFRSREKLFPRQKESRTTTSATASTKSNTMESHLPAKRLSASVKLVTRDAERTMDALPGGRLTTSAVRSAWEWDPAVAFCSQRSAGIAHNAAMMPSCERIASFVPEEPLDWFVRILFGKQARQAALDNWIHEGNP